MTEATPPQRTVSPTVRLGRGDGLIPRLDLWEWQFDANCRGEDPATFFHPDHERGHARAQRHARALALCGQCPVRAQCSEHALAVPERFGIWGGVTEDQRHRLLGTARVR